MIEIESIFEKFFTKQNIRYKTESSPFYVKFYFNEVDLTNLSGAWKIVRESPFSKNKKIHTSFCNVVIYDNRGEFKLKLKDNDLNWDFFKSTGPGGQNKNKTLTAVRLTHVPTGIVVISTQQRSQYENKNQAYKQLEERFWEEFEKIRLVEKESNWQNSSEKPNITLYFNHKICLCEKTGRKSQNLNAFCSGDLSVLI